MKHAVLVESVSIGFLHGAWFLPALELAVSRLAPASRCGVREVGWLVYATVVVTSPWHVPVFGWGGWMPAELLLIGLLPGLWGLGRWVMAVHMLHRTPSEPWRSYRGVRVDLGDVPVALTWGAWVPRIVLPRSVLTWSAARLDAVLAHEYAHVARHDYLRRFVSQLVGMVLGAHPAFWFSRARHALDVELAADARALIEGGVDRHTYAQTLLDLGVAATQPPAALAVRSGPSPLARRIEAVLQPRGRSAVGFVMAGVLGAGLIACVVPSPPPPDAAEAPVVVAPPPPPACDF